jgi:hypothetical protein
MYLYFQTKENQLQDLLEAKTLALTQADRLIAQHRSRKASYEAEVNIIVNHYILIGHMYVSNQAFWISTKQIQDEITL